MRRLRAPALGARAIAALLVLAAAVLPGSSPARGEPAEFPGNAEELAAYELLHDDKPITARTRAEAILRAEPDSIVGHYVLGTALREAEGSLARAVSHLRLSRRLFEDRYRGGAIGGKAALLYREILRGLEHTLGLMERYEEQLAILRDYDDRFEPPLLGQRAWPLMKLHRYAEARGFAQMAIDSQRPVQRSIGLNALCAIDAEERDRKAAYESCLRALDFARERARESKEQDPERRPHIAVHAYNASLSALGVLRHDEAERLALEGTARTERSASNPWMLLVHLYLAEGRGGDAVSAIRKMLSWFAQQPPGARDQKSAQTDAITATLLLVAGEAEAGIAFVSRALTRPDRQGISSAVPEQALGGHALIRRALLRTQAELEAERASTRDMAERGAGLASSAWTRSLALVDGERVVSVLADASRLSGALRVYVDGGLDDLPSWLMGDLVEVLGAGVVEAALSRARSDERTPEVGPFFDALEAEVALRKGDVGRARELAEGAFEHLPRAEALMRARVSAVAGEAARRGGDIGGSVGLFQRALGLDPGTIRRLGLRLPAVVRYAGGGAAGTRAAELLGRSPRLVAARGGFEVRVEASGAGLKACLWAPMEAALGCGEVTPKEGESADAFGARLAREFHRAVFALRLPITDVDIRSLDGVTRMSRDVEREKLRELLDTTPASGLPKGDEEGEE